MKSSKIMAVSAFMALLVAPALAENDQNMQGMQGMHGMNMQGDMNMMGMHEIPVTVTSIDMNTGMMEATSSDIKLRLHFPPASLATVKPGDKITVHMGFMK